MENKELMDCEYKEIETLLRGMPYYPSTERGWINFVKRCLKAQLNSPKLAEYILGKKLEAIEALNQYNMGTISGERCAEIIGINYYELQEIV